MMLMTLRQASVGFALAAGVLHAAGVLAQAPVTDFNRLDERLARIERLLDADGLVKLFDDVKSQDVEVRELRGQFEELSHAVKQLRERQRELYLDIDQRLQRLETAGAGVTPEPSQPLAGTPEAPTASISPTPTQTSTQAVEPAAGSEPSTGVDPFAEQQAYQSAFELLKAGRYEDAAEAFHRFIARYPAGSYADNAQYWLGETYYITRDFESAVREFERLIETHPNSGKLTHAMLKIGYAHDELGNRAEAEGALDDLVTRFPQSAAAGLARKRLQTIRQ